jgi:uncharacterized membrane protein required for colicin V production
MNILDIIVIGIIGFCALNGLFKGLVKTLFGLSSTIIALILTLLITPQLSSLIVTNTSFDEIISEKTVELLKIENLLWDKDASLDTTISEGALKLPKNLLEFLTKNNTPETNQLLEAKGLGDYISSSMATMAVNVFILIVVFMIISLVLNALVVLLDIVAHLPVIKTMNKLGGFTIGLVIGIIIVWVSTLALSFIISTQASDTISKLIEESILTKLFYYYNPLQNFVMNIPRTLK